MNTIWIFFYIILCFTGGLVATDVIVETQPTVYGKENHDVQIPCGSNLLLSKTIVKWKFGATLENAALLVFLDHGAVGGLLLGKGYDLLKNGSLLINNITTTNSGLYFCIVEDSLGNTGYNTSRLEVKLKPVLSQLLINFCGMNNTNCTRNFQTNLTLPLMCTARSARAAVSLKWKSNVSDVPQRIQSLTGEQDGMFISNTEINVQFNGAVQYICYVLNTKEYNLPESSVYINISPVHLCPEISPFTIEPSSCSKWAVPVTLLCTIIFGAIISVIARILYKHFHRAYSQVPSPPPERGSSATSGSEKINSIKKQASSAGGSDRVATHRGSSATSRSEKINLVEKQASPAGEYQDVFEYEPLYNLRDRQENAQQTSDFEFQIIMTIKAREGTTITLPCLSSETRDVVWIRRTQDDKNQFLYVGRNSCGSTGNFLTSNGNLTIVQLKQSDQGKYITGSLQILKDDCIATAYNVICDESCKYINYTADHGSTIILPLDFSLRDESDKVEWSSDSFYGDITETGNKDKYRRQKNGNLLIRQLDEDDNCIFYCKLNDEIIYYSVTVEDVILYR